MSRDAMDHDGMVYADSVVDLVGNTPLVRLSRVAAGLAPLVLAKVEYLNPGGGRPGRAAHGRALAADRGR
jgi:cystathionine beta-synthase